MSSAETVFLCEHFGLTGDIFSSDPEKLKQAAITYQRDRWKFQRVFETLERQEASQHRSRKALIPRTLWLKVMLRDGKCRHCGTIENLTCDHVVPESKGGATTEENLQALCRPCNSRKGVKVA